MRRGTRPVFLLLFFSRIRRHTRYIGDWSSDLCSSDLGRGRQGGTGLFGGPRLCRLGLRGDANIREVRQRLRFSVDQHLKVRRREISDVVPFSIGNHSVHLDERRGDAEDRPAVWIRRRNGGRLLPEKQQRAKQNAERLFHLVRSSTPRSCNLPRFAFAPEVA